MNTRTLKISLLSAAMLVGTSTAQAEYRDSDDLMVRARVVSSTPVYESVNEPRRECWTESSNETRSYRNNNTGGSILGAIAGGLIGSTVGKGNGRVAAAAVGAATGAVVGDRWNDGERRASYPQQVERCRSVDNVRQVVSGYDVRYRFEGREFNTRLPYDPGDWLNLKVSFAVAEDPRGGRSNHSRNRWNDNDWDNN
ncbi:MAG: glycine zipper 2TM domain-containing protein [Thiobacillaceae bacterium]